MTSTPLPEDFPQASPTGAVPGAQPKLLAHELRGRLVVGQCDQDVRERYVMCEDLAHQLVAYSARKRTDNPFWSETQLRDKVAQSVRQKAFGWGLSPAEAEWVLERIDALTLTAARKDHEWAHLSNAPGP